MGYSQSKPTRSVRVGSFRRRCSVDELLGHALSTHPEVAEELLHPTVTTSCRASDF